MRRALYRVGQFVRSLSGRLSRERKAQVESWLTPPLFELFCRLTPSEQYHAYHVRQTLAADGHTSPDLLTAALLHDVGKSKMPLAIWERVLIVLGFKFAPARAFRWGTVPDPSSAWVRPFVVAVHHPEWGAEMVKAAGGTELAVELIRRHQEGKEREREKEKERELLSVLQHADNSN